MSEVRVRNVESWVVEWHRQAAKRGGLTLEAELRRIMTQAALDRRHAIVADMRSDLNELQTKYGIFPDSALDIRQDRERRG
jgi:hypothetical protein